jgi:hypothetical protein
MIVIETKEKKWYCTENKKVADKICGKNDENVLNLWYQPFPYPCDFFWVIKDGSLIEETTPMREWERDLPLSKCLEGGVEWVAPKSTTKPPKWYREFLNTDWVECRNEEKENALKYYELIEKAKEEGDDKKASDLVLDWMMGKKI